MKNAHALLTKTNNTIYINTVTMTTLNKMQKLSSNPPN